MPHMTEAPEKFLEVSTVARMLNVSTRTIERMIRDPECPLVGIRLNRRCIRVLKSSILALIEQRRI